jgi:hypothetical protein
VFVSVIGPVELRLEALMAHESHSAQQTGTPSHAAAPAGVVYSCSGDFYVAEALRSARSSLRYNRLPHLVFSSVDADEPENVSISRFEPSQNPFADKIANMRRSPFERTIYLDSDTYVVDQITDVLRLLDRYDMAIAFAPYRPLEDPEVPPPFYEFNTGVIAWRASDRMAAFMLSWEQTYLAWLTSEPFPGAGAATRGGRADQPAFRRCAWQHDVQLFVLAPEYNFRIDYPTAVRERVRVVHGRHDDYESLVARVNYKRGARTWPQPRSLRGLLAERARRVTGAPRGGKAGRRDAGSGQDPGGRERP